MAQPFIGFKEDHRDLGPGSLIDRDADWGLIPPRMWEGIAAYVNDRRPTGGFLTQCLENKLQAALSGDAENQAAILGWAQFLTYYLPSECWGSEAKVTAWLAGRTDVSDDSGDDDLKTATRE